MYTTQQISCYNKLTELIIKMENFTENFVEKLTESVESILNETFKNVKLTGEDCDVLRRAFVNR